MDSNQARKPSLTEALAERNAPKPPVETTDLEALLMIDRWQQLKAIIDNAEAELKSLRDRVIELANQGVTFDNGTVRLSMEEHHTYTVDNDALRQALPATTYVLLAEISAAKLRALVTTGQMAQTTFDKYVTDNITPKVVVRKSGGGK